MDLFVPFPLAGRSPSDGASRTHFPHFRGIKGLKAPYTLKMGGSGTIWPHLRDRASGKPGTSGPPIFPDRTRAAIPRAKAVGMTSIGMCAGHFSTPVPVIISIHGGFPVKVILLFCWHRQLPRPTVRFSSNDLHRFWESSMLVTLTT